MACCFLKRSILHLLKMYRVSTKRRKARTESVPAMMPSSFESPGAKVAMGTSSRTSRWATK